MSEGLFERTLSYPDVDARDRYARLVGIDGQKSALVKMLGALVNPAGLQAWAKQHHPHARALVDVLSRRAPLVVLAGDVGSGKTELAETIGDAVARQERIEVTLFPLSLSARGQGRVGEMTQLLSGAFAHVASEAAKLKGSDGKRNRGAVLLLVDEADALAQSRESAQMHHEDRAGVNAFIRGIDRLASQRLPAAVLMCTNRLSALDPAIRRRAAEVLPFERPNPGQRYALLAAALEGVEFSDGEVRALVEATGATCDRPYGFTFSDLTQRLLPAFVLDAYPEQRLRAVRAVEIAQQMLPTPPFKDTSL